eukprot:TRINITY_DN25629_c0_g1_i1.p3 TRINITY_DN25629_c0_g1~~TRINITY_DN25629_c0_g1_i1.p3  ORF type:complete len:192 (+),score=-6.88 TRINITY_DN25629_c0_g1_i1:232-807(+)
MRSQENMLYKPAFVFLLVQVLEARIFTCLQLYKNQMFYVTFKINEENMLQRQHFYFYGIKQRLCLQFVLQCSISQLIWCRKLECMMNLGLQFDQILRFLQQVFNFKIFIGLDYQLGLRFGQIPDVSQIYLWIDVFFYFLFLLIFAFNNFVENLSCFSVCFFNAFEVLLYFQHFLQLYFDCDTVYNQLKKQY